MDNFENEVAETPLESRQCPVKREVVLTHTSPDISIYSMKVTSLLIDYTKLTKTI